MSEVLLKQLIHEVKSLRARMEDLETAGVRSYGCAFLAYNSAVDVDVTGDNTVYTVDFDTEVFDLGGDFAADTFTAPATGKYLLSTGVRMYGFAGDHTRALLNIITSNRNRPVWDDYDVASATTILRGGSITVDMDAADTAYVTLAVYGTTKVVDVYGHAAWLYTFFSGHRIA